MTIGILGKKLGMMQFFQADGTWVPVTVVQAGPCKVLQVKVKELDELPEDQRTTTRSHGKRTGKVQSRRRVDGYWALQLGFEDKPAKAAGKGETAQAALAGTTPQRFVREVRLDAAPQYKRGDEVRVDVLADVKRVDVTGTTKGRGFTGTIKRWNFHRQPMSHGNSKHHRKVGGIGRTYSISKGVPKGKHMSGHYGVEQVTIPNMEVMKIDTERNLIFIRGAVPGHRSAYVVVRKAFKTR